MLEIRRLGPQIGVEIRGIDEMTGVLQNAGVDQLHVMTLNEVRRCASAGIRVSSFALIEDYFYLGLVNFVEEMARVSQGVAAYCSADDLGKYVFDSFIGGRRTRRISQ